MKKIWFDEAWEDYLYWQTQDKKTLKRSNLLLKDIERGHFDGLGKPEPLKGDLSGFWSRRIDDVNRLVYRICENVLEIASRFMEELLRFAKDTAKVRILSLEVRSGCNFKLRRCNRILIDRITQIPYANLQKEGYT